MQAPKSSQIDTEERGNFSLLHAGMWALTVACGWFLYVLVHAVLAGITFGQTLACLFFATPLLAVLVGKMQQLILRDTQYYKLADGWAIRSAIGWGVSIALAYVTVFAKSVLFSHPFRLNPAGDLLDLGSFIVGLCLMGAVVGIAQLVGFPDWGEMRTKLRESAWWIVVNCLAWGVGGIAFWVPLKLYVIEGYQPICIDCVLRIFWALLVGGITAGVITGLALWNRVAALALAVATVAVCFAIVRTDAHNTGTPLFEAIHKGPFTVLGSPVTYTVPDMAFSPDGRVIAVVITDVFTGSLSILSTSNWEPLEHRQIPDSPQAVAFSPDGKYLGIQTTSGKISTLKVDDLTEVDALWTGVFKSSKSSLSADEQVYAEGLGETITIQDRAGGGSVRTLQAEHTITALSLTPQGDKVAAFWGTSGKLWRVSDGQELLNLQTSEFGSGSDAAVYNLEFSPDGRILAGGSRYGNVELWEIGR